MKLLIKIICLVLSCFMLLLCFSSCLNLTEIKKYSDYSFEYFDTSTQIIGYAVSREEFDNNCKIIKSALAEYHKLYDIYFSYEGINNIYTINSKIDGTHKEVKVDRKIIDLLLYSKDIFVKTNGYTNIAMGSVLSIWHLYRENGINEPDKAALPPIDSLIKASQHTDIDNLIIDEINNTVFLSDPDMSLDVGAIAKGYAVECVAKMMYDSGMTGYLLNVGGNIRTIGARGDEHNWEIGIENPDTTSDEKYIEYLSVCDYSVVTSGSYRRFYTVDGVKYNHIINPDTLYPGNYFDSVTVISRNSGLGDSLSTALFCMNINDGLEFVNSDKDIEAMWVSTGGQKYYSDNFKDFTFDYKSNN